MTYYDLLKQKKKKRKPSVEIYRLKTNNEYK